MKLCIFVTHPVQYHVPLWRSLAALPGLDVKVFYFSDHSVRGGVDPEFGVPVRWDTDLLSGYEHEFLARDSQLQHPRSVRIAGVRALLERERAEWILIAGYTYGFEHQLLLAARSLGARIVMRGEFSDASHGLRGRTKALARDLALRVFYSRVDRFCYPGHAAFAHLARLGVPAERCFFSPYSVDDRAIAEQCRTRTRADARRELGVPNDLFVLLFSGKLIARKAPGTVVRALQQVADCSRVGLIVLGEGELRGSFEGEARALLGERLRMPGFVNQSELAPYFLAADAFVMTSEHETWGLVVNEAMHYGLPVLTSDAVGCHLDLVREGVTGFVHAVGDAAALARHIEALLAAPERARELGRAARRQVSHYRVADSARGVRLALGMSPPSAADVS